MPGVLGLAPDEGRLGADESTDSLELFALETIRRGASFHGGRSVIEIATLYEMPFIFRTSGGGSVQLRSVW